MYWTAMKNFNVRIPCVLIVVNLFINVIAEARSVSLTKHAGKSWPGHLTGIISIRNNQSLSRVAYSFGKDQRSTPVNGDDAFVPVPRTGFLPVYSNHLSLEKMRSKIIHASRVSYSFPGFLLVRMTITQSRFDIN